MSRKTVIHELLETFADDVSIKLNQLTQGEPEDQLRGPFENFLTHAAVYLGWNVVCTGETPLPNHLGKPDYAVHCNQLLAGYVELKATGVGADTEKFAGHNRDQWKRFKSIPNILYCDGNDWAIYRNGKLINKIVCLSGDLVSKGKKTVSLNEAYAIERLLREFFSWQPIIPTNQKGKIDLKGLAELLAPLCRMLRDDVKDAIKNPLSPLVQLAKNWRQLLFPDATDAQFADAYAQTVTFALLLGRSEGADPLTLEKAEKSLASDHSLLSRALIILTDQNARVEISASLDLLLRVITVVPIAALTGPEDPWLYFYEDFLTVYDPKLRKSVGAYYTPVEVVHAQVRLIDDLLVNKLGKSFGFADPSVITIDPAVGTGTYLLGVIEHALSKIEVEQGVGAVPGQATNLAANLYGFEIMVGPYSVTELRLSRALRDRGATLPADGTHIYLTDTLESPYTEPPELPLFLKPISEQHAKALEVKSNVPVIVCLGNPPYLRHEAVTDDNKARYGGWVRWGDDGEGRTAIFRKILDPVILAGHGGDVKNIYNLYAYFWSWALWKVFEHTTASEPGIVSFISASSYIDGDAFCGLREHMRRLCDEIWLIDLGGEGRGTRKSDNVFAIQTPVAIAVAVRYGKQKSKIPAKVNYARIDGNRKAKLAKLDSILEFSALNWEVCPEEWQAPFRPAGKGDYFNWPLFTDLMPWQHSGVQLKRTWPIAPDRETLMHRWTGLLQSSDRSKAFRETDDRKIDRTYHAIMMTQFAPKPIAQLQQNTPMQAAIRYAYRSFDRQYVIADGRLMSRPRPILWHVNSEKQLYLSSLFSHPLGSGPSLTSSAFIPDLDHFRGSYGAKAVIPLYRDADATKPNILSGLIDLLNKTYKRKITPEDFLSYVYGVLAQPSFTGRFKKELVTQELRVPITKNASLFCKVCDIGSRLLWLHTYAERFIPKGKRRGVIPRGTAKCVKAILSVPEEYPESYEYNDTTQTLHVGKGEFKPVTPDIFGFEVSGLKVVQSWLKYRMKKGTGKKSSPLDDIRPMVWSSQFTTEFLELLWVLESTIKGYPEQTKLLKQVINSNCFLKDDLPDVIEEMRKPVKQQLSGDLFSPPPTKSNET